MGVQIADILEKEELSFKEIRGRIAIDAYNTLYQFLTIIRSQEGAPLMDSQGRITSHLSGMFYRTCNLLEKGVRPVFVFDGKPTDLKRRTIEERAERKREAAEKLASARERGDLEGIRTFAQQTAHLDQDMVAESKRLLELMGIPVVQALSEGEAQCARMCANGLVEATGSQDFDSLLFGTPVMIKNLTIAGRRKMPRRNQYVEVLPERIDLNANLERLGITREKLVWIGLLAGTDFNKGIHGVGAKKGLKLVKEFDSLEAIFQKLETTMDYAPVRELFMNPPYQEVSADQLKPRAPNREAVLEFMAGHDFSSERVSAALARAFKDPMDSTQGKLNQWF